MQFVVFFVCGRAPGLGHALSTKLLDILSDESKPKVKGCNLLTLKGRLVLRYLW